MQRLPRWPPSAADVPSGAVCGLVGWALRLLAPVIRTGYAGAMPTRFIRVGKIARKPSACIASSRQAILPTLRILFPDRYRHPSPGFRLRLIRATLAPIGMAAARETRNDATVRGHPGNRRDPRAGGAVRGLSAGGAGRRRDQGRASRRSRPEPRLRHRQGAQPPQHGHRLPDAGLQQALDRARPQAGRRSRGPQEAGRHRGCLRGELPARRVRGAGARLRGARRHQSAADLRLVLGLRPERAARRPDRLRPRDPGHLRHHGDDRHHGRASREDRRAGGRLRHRHDRRLRAVGRAVPA